MAISALRQRIRDQSLTTDIVASALGIPMIIDRVLDGPPGGVTYVRIENWLNDIERTGYTPGSVTILPDARPGCTKAQGGICGCPVCGHERIEAKAAQEAFEVANRQKILDARAAATERYVQEAIDRTRLGMELKGLREDANLTQAEAATLIGLEMTVEQLSRLERGKPLGTRYLPEVIAGYRGLAKLSSKAKKAAKS
jgi:DNA-binding XRE family transcriptional regulator